MTEVRWNADDCARISELHREWADQLIRKLASGGSERVPGVGCGDGKVTAELAERVPGGEVVGVDSSADMVALAARRFSPGLHRNLRFLVADARELPFDGEFDVVFSNAALHWVVFHCPVLAGLCRALVPGGRLLLQMGGTGNAADVVAAADRLRTRPDWAPYLRDFPFPYGFHGPEEYSAWLAEAGSKPRASNSWPGRPFSRPARPSRPGSAPPGFPTHSGYPKPSGQRT